MLPITPALAPVSTPSRPAADRAGSRAVGSMVVATAVWGGHYVVAAVAVAGMTPLALTWWRWVIAVVPLVVCAQVIEHPDWRAALRELPRVALLAGCGMIAYSLFLYGALQHTSATGASLINAANPALIALLAALLVRERLRRAGVAGIGLSLVGVLVVISQGSPGALLGADVNVGQLLMLGAITCWSLYTILGRTVRLPPITSTALQAAAAVVVLAPFAGTAHAGFPHDGRTLAALLFVGLLPSVASYVLWNSALREVPAGTAGIYLNLITVFTILIGLAIGERMTGWDLAGGLVVVAGVVLTTWSALRRGRPAPTVDEVSPAASRGARPPAGAGPGSSHTCGARTRSGRRARPRPPRPARDHRR